MKAICVDYDERVKKIRADIERGGEEDLKRAADGLKHLEDVRPASLEYLFAKIAFLIAIGEDKTKIFNMLNGIDSEYYPHVERAELFRLKERLFLKGSLRAKAADFSARLYSGESTAEYMTALERAKKSVLGIGEEVSDDVLKELTEMYFITRNTVLYTILMSALLARRGVLSRIEKGLEPSIGDGSYFSYGDDYCNVGYLLRQFLDGKERTYIIVDELEGDNSDNDVLSLGLHMLGEKVILLRDADERPDIKNVSEAVTYSVGRAHVVNDTIIVPITLYDDGRDNTAALVLFLASSLEQDCAPIVFTSDRNMTRLHQDKTAAKKIQRLSIIRPQELSDKIAFAWAGDYTKYISYIYGIDVMACIEKKPKCNISIVIPVKNSAKTLKYTLQTCLNQSFSGSYEVLVSDNSDKGNTDVFKVCEEIDDSRLRYIKAPFDLPLSKSFEYAFLQTNGEFIFSLGADDGVFPWALETINSFVKRLKNDDILAWIRGFYAWPGFNGGQQNQLLLRTLYKEYEIGFGVLQPDFNLLTTQKGTIYVWPSLYINSGFKRGYFKKLLQTTGRLWDTSAQDIPMIAINATLFEEWWFVHYPLTMAGMSSASIGHRELAMHDDLEKSADMAQNVDYLNRIGEYAFNEEEGMYSFVPGNDANGFYYSLLRLVGNGCAEKVTINGLDWRAIFLMLARSISPYDLRFEKYYGFLKQAAAFHSEEIMRLVEETYHQNNVARQKMPRRTISLERAYNVGFSKETGSFTIDAAEFGIENIREAVDFIVKLFGLKNTRKTCDSFYT